jgi:predicted O-methyltransferase YrrM
MKDRLLKEASVVQDLKSQEGVMSRFYDLFESGVIEGDILEIGCFLGKTTVFLTRMCEELYPDRKVFSIDPHTDDSLQEITAPNKQQGTVHQHFINHTKHLKNHKYYREYSFDVACKFEDKSLAFAFIDGLHSYEGVIKDYELYIPKIKLGGIVVFDDYLTPKFGVGRAIKEVISKDDRLKLIKKNEKEIYFKVVK